MQTKASSSPICSGCAPLSLGASAVATHRSWSFPRASDSPSSSPPAGPKRSCSPKKCAFPLCRNSARSRGFCYSHGGGRRCGVHGCNNGAVSRDLCKRHGGGRRCRVDGCKSSAESGGLCYSHGGGRRCSLSWCSARAKKGGLCVVHWTTSGRTAAADAALTDTSSEGSDVVETLLALAKEPLEGKTGAAVSMAGAWSVQGSSAQSAYAITSLLN
ncbi:unnamed protein product [Hyaloperonospora brassicae]|uniref:WRKY19-like zinc finger domain-containing protein n=1 Tax=Hyaloperonospora brassicae TaxID=162125 RepID=A0AAV0U103_HYABA|nr:unnamed protein product [Hyaloperonospora brassicae]